MPLDLRSETNQTQRREKLQIRLTDDAKFNLDLENKAFGLE